MYTLVFYRTEFEFPDVQCKEVSYECLATGFPSSLVDPSWVGYWDVTKQLPNVSLEPVISVGLAAVPLLRMTGFTPILLEPIPSCGLFDTLC